MTTPIDLLPVKRPFSDPNPPDDTFFYENVVKELLPDIWKMERTGIPINLEKVKEIEEITDRILQEIASRISQNGHIQRFLEARVQDYTQDPKGFKKRSQLDYYKEFNRKNVAQRSFIINAYLRNSGHEKDCMEKWSIKDAKLYTDATGLFFPAEVVSENPNVQAKFMIEQYNTELAQTKADIYNKNIEEKVKNNAEKITFNPGSPKQKADLFKFLGIEPLGKTKKGQDKWDRENLEQLLKQLELELEDENESE